MSTITTTTTTMAMSESPRHAGTLLTGIEVGAVVLAGVGALRPERIAACAELFPEARIWALEPDADHVAALTARLHDAPSASTAALALADRAGPATLYVARGAAEASLLPPLAGAARPTVDGPPPDAAAEDAIEERAVEAETLDGLCAREGIERVDALVLDLRGAELRALQGAAGLLEAGRIELVYATVLFTPTYRGQASLASVEAYLGAAGYRLFDLYDLEHGAHGRLERATALFVSPAREEALRDAPDPVLEDPIQVQYVPFAENVLVVVRVSSPTLDVVGAQIVVNGAPDGSPDGDWTYLTAPPLDDRRCTWAVWDTRGFEPGLHLVAVNLLLADGGIHWFGHQPPRHYRLE